MLERISAQDFSSFKAAKFEPCQMVADEALAVNFFKK